VAIHAARVHQDPVDFLKRGASVVVVLLRRRRSRRRWNRGRPIGAGSMENRGRGQGGDGGSQHPKCLFDPAPRPGVVLVHGNS